MASLNKEIFINVSQGESRVAVVEDGQLQEIYIERSAKKNIVGNVYKGKVTRVVPAMQAAFVDIGLSKPAFLHVRDAAVTAQSLTHKVPKALLAIEKLLHQGQIIKVQIIKDQIGEKGARVSSEISLASANLVYLPTREGVALSHKIQDKSKRETLLREIQALYDAGVGGGFIVRSQAQWLEEYELQRDTQVLLAEWEKAKLRVQQTKAPALIYEDLALPLRALREVVSQDTKRIKIDCLETFKRAMSFAQDFVPTLCDKLEVYEETPPLFDEHRIDEQINSALAPKINLALGGNLVIERTEAMTVIDVNTGSYLASKDAANMAVNTNIEAATELARQLRLRNIGGIIIVDFVDMPTEHQRKKVLKVLRDALKIDRTETSVSEFSTLGLVEITRKRSRQTLYEMMCESCSQCLGSGYVKTVETLSYEILRELLRQSQKFLAPAYTIVVSSELGDLFSGDKRVNIEKLEGVIDRPIRIQHASHNLLHEFEIVWDSLG